MRALPVRPIVIAHRGLPTRQLEHSAASYVEAMSAGADYVEPDVVSSSDGVLVIRHENEIGETTDVAERPEFAGRRRTVTVDGVPRSGWFSEDFTWAELQTLRLRERIPELRPQNRDLDGSQRMLSLAELVELVGEENRSRGTQEPAVGIYVETKHPTHFRALGLDLEPRLLELVEQISSPVIIQSMETNLRWFAAHCALPLVQLMEKRGGPFDLSRADGPTTYADLMSDAGLAGIAEYAHGIGPHKDLVISRDADGQWVDNTGLVARAHDAGLFVHPWTMRDENAFLPLDLRNGDDPAAVGDAEQEIARFLDAGVDGVFSDDCRLAATVRDRWVADRQA